MKRKSLVLSALALSLAMAMGSTTANAAESAASAASSGQLPSTAPMLEKVMPSVVSIYVEGHTTKENNAGKEGIPPQLQPFLVRTRLSAGTARRSSRLRCVREKVTMMATASSSKTGNFRALGAGVVINAEKGYVVTNSHVVENADKIQVRLSDGRKYDGKVLGKDPRSDIALVQLKDFKNLTAIKVADSDQLRVGDYTVAIGNPYGLGETATSGIVSALGRSGLNIENYENFIQTDAAINRGIPVARW